MASVSAQTEYKEFKRSAALVPLFTLKGDKGGNLTVMSPRLTGPVGTPVPSADSIQIDTVLILQNGIIFHADRLTVGDMVFRYDEIVDLRIENLKDTTVVVFSTSPDTTRSITRLRQGNIIRAFAPVVVDSQQFVRGGIFTVSGDITVAGEVNKDVVSLFGRITATATGVVRGGTATLFGQLEVSKGSTMYGSLLSPQRKLMRRFQLMSRDRELTIDPDIRYNRVDGFMLTTGLKFQDHDSLLPSIWASGGYAFESERWRYKFGVEQTIAKSRSLVIGGEAYRKLASDDDWILSDYENLAFVILAREDFKDYYEAEGGRVYARIRPFEQARLGVEFRSEATHWLDAHPRLWALFGGNKRFRDNFSTVDPTFRSVGKAEIESTTVAGLNFSAEYDSRSKMGVFNQSAWHVEGNLDWSNKDLGSDFDFRRYTVALTRYQKIQKESMLLLRATYGGSDGYLPMHRRFYMGGLGSWQGYKHKEYMGSRFWMTNAEYRVVIPGSDLALATFWDCGQIANDAPLDDKADIKNSIGMAGYLGSSFRLSVAKRLDRSEDDGPKIYVRLAHHF
jgi:hypothetical protein